MSDLLVIVFPSEEKAQQGRGELLSMEKQDLSTMEDAVFAVKNADGSVKLNQLVSPSAFWGFGPRRVATPLRPAQVH